MTERSESPAPSDPFDAVIGQKAAVAQLRAAVVNPVHAYLIVGPPGSGTRPVATAFAAALLSADLDDAPSRERTIRLVGEGKHPDLRVIERRGPAITVEQAQEIITEANRSAIEGARKVLVLVDLHLVQPAVEAKLLKTIEEPPDGVVFVVLVETVPPLLLPVASRCVRVDLEPLPQQLVLTALREAGVDDAVAAELAIATGGDLDRARLLAGDPRFTARRAAWRAVPEQLDGTGARVHGLVAGLVAQAKDAQSVAERRHAEEVAELEDAVQRYGGRGTARRELAERQRRELRRVRTDELRYGLATLAGRYRDVLAAGDARGARATPILDALDRIGAANEALIRNPNETLLLQSLLLRLPGVRPVGAGEG